MEVAGVSTERFAAQPRYGARPETVDEQIRRKGIQPIESVDELACDGIWESDEELQEFLDQLYKWRRSGMA